MAAEVWLFVGSVAIWMVAHLWNRHIENVVWAKKEERQLAQKGPPPEVPEQARSAERHVPPWGPTWKQVLVAPFGAAVLLTIPMTWIVVSSDQERDLVENWARTTSIVVVVLGLLALTLYLLRWARRRKLLKTGELAVASIVAAEPKENDAGVVYGTTLDYGFEVRSSSSARVHHGKLKIRHPRHRGKLPRWPDARDFAVVVYDPKKPDSNLAYAFLFNGEPQFG